MNTIIPYGKQEITPEDIQSVVEALQSDFLTQGPKIIAFEQQFAQYTGSQYAVAVSNGTAALHLAVMSLNLQPDEYVICTPITFSASANCVKYVGGRVLFADIDPKTYLMTPESVHEVIRSNPGKKIKGLIPVDFAGRVPQLDAFRELADEYDLWIIEDACHAPGGYFIDQKKQKQSVGNGLFADLSIFSFHPVKHIATGEGGMITTNNESLYKRLLTLRTHGITRETSLFENSIEFANGNSTADNYPVWYMEMQELGYNYRITDFQAALGISQLNRAESNLEKRRSIAKRYTEAFNEIPQVIHHSGWIEGHAYHLFILEVENRRGLYDYLKTQSIFAQIHYIPVHLMPYYRHQGWKEGDFPNAERYYSRCISIPMYPSLTGEEVNFVIKTIKDFYML
ncbi:UDP-4-amino-4,6-dideoxy-N-acetyl-beta-L-altrosamine transaminase [Fluviicola sp.]|jgi:UDP-4-amino-4,6-dideoxy-N-acetyl-beta-L-altrosamine transaminase|uniref:UDP-4-amino-4, 6-dideoxy-N-acetyl-beta-L-altrosamine transaminase n=1 Tax=Fluviicola sp. TaxID=1917219 RepID=UPI002837953E|nr:UDP-4-amino-4,6-dideoxy-N-acetyl-beta-L-altrosamine transaminase [Fluviicola sp.]MDR0801812.1 UDP-4-amino-4,6-dideoxy-N-acetyl-beta-L-altrosamine transaminase [Fluviicola sp.]